MGQTGVHIFLIAYIFKTARVISMIFAMPHHIIRISCEVSKQQLDHLGDRHIGKCLKCCNSPNSGPIWTKLGWPHPITSLTCPP